MGGTARLRRDGGAVNWPVWFIQHGIGKKDFIRLAWINCIIALVIIIAFPLLSACAATPPKQIVQYKTVEVPTYIRAPIPEQYTQDRIVVEPKPACGALYCNGQLAYIIDDYRAALRQSNLDKAALRSLDSKEKP